MRALLPTYAYLLLMLLSISPVGAEPALRVGAIVPLTGAGASYGAAIKNGFQMALDANPRMVNQFKIVWEDSHLDGAAAVSAYRKLMVSDKVNAIFVWGAGPADAVAPVTAREGVPTFAVTADRTISIERANVFRFHYHAGDYVKPLGRYIREHNLKTLALLSSQIAYFEAVTKALRAELGADAKILERGFYAPNDSDFRPVITKLKKESPDGVLIFLLPGQIAAFHRQAEQLGFRTRILGTDFYDSTEEILNAGPNSSGAVFPAFAVDESFRERYVQRFGNDIQLPYAANTYDFFNFLAQIIAAHESPAPSGDALIHALRNAPFYRGVSGQYTYVESAGGSGFNVEVALKEVSGGALKYLHTPVIINASQADR